MLDEGIGDDDNNGEAAADGDEASTIIVKEEFKCAGDQGSPT